MAKKRNKIATLILSHARENPEFRKIAAQKVACSLHGEEDVPLPGDILTEVELTSSITWLKFLSGKKIPANRRDRNPVPKPKIFFGGSDLWSRSFSLGGATSVSSSHLYQEALSLLCRREFLRREDMEISYPNDEEESLIIALVEKLRQRKKDGG